VLKKVEERIDNGATQSTVQVPDARLGEGDSAHSNSEPIEQMARVKTLSAQLENWRDYLKQEPRQPVIHHV